LSHSISPFLGWVFSREGLANYLLGLAWNHNPPDLCLLSSKDYRQEQRLQTRAKITGMSKDYRREQGLQA
jgi:hypothetical protein